MKLEIYHKRFGKSANRYKLNNMLLSDEWINQEIKEIKNIYIYGKQENKNIMFQNLGDAAKEVLKGKFITTQTYIKK